MDPLSNQSRPFPPMSPLSSVNSGGNSSESGSRAKKVFFALIILAIILVLGFVATLAFQKYFKGGNSTGSSNLPLGYQKLQELSSKNKTFISGVSIQTIFNGRLTKREGGRTWVLEKDGNSLTLNHTGNTNIRFLRRNAEKGKPSIQVGSDNIKNGEDVSVLVLIDLNSSNMRIVSIEAKTPSASQSNQETPASTPSATQ